MDGATAAGGKTYYLSVTPQCPYPDIYTNDILAGIDLDYVMVQFYNNVCGVSSFVPGASTQKDFTFPIWDSWTRISKNPNTRILLGILGNNGSGAGYVSGFQLSSAISFCKAFSSFGGVMIWDMSQVYNNLGFLSAVASDLGRTTTLLASATSKTTLATTMPTSELVCGG
jgi:chitinase